jgi:hypothetical protein
VSSPCIPIITLGPDQSAVDTCAARLTKTTTLAWYSIMVSERRDFSGCTRPYQFRKACCLTNHSDARSNVVLYLRMVRRVTDHSSRLRLCRPQLNLRQPSRRHIDGDGRARVRIPTSQARTHHIVMDRTLQLQHHNISAAIITIVQYNHSYPTRSHNHYPFTNLLAEHIQHIQHS